MDFLLKKLRHGHSGNFVSLPQILSLYGFAASRRANQNDGSRRLQLGDCSLYDSERNRKRDPAVMVSGHVRYCAPGRTSVQVLRDLDDEPDSFRP
jgi:hypothetical protein